MIQGFETREQTDIPIRALVKSANGILHKRNEVVGQYEKTNWATFKTVKDYPCAVFGILRGTADIIRECQKEKQDFYYFDHAYFLGNKHSISNEIGDKIYRLTKNHYHIQKIETLNNEDKKRIEKYRDYLFSKLEPWKTSGKHIIIIEPSEFQIWYHNIHNWVENTVNILKQHTDREIIVRTKQSQVSLDEHLNNAHAVVTHNSNVVFQALLKGIPCFVDKINMGVEICDTDFTKIETPKKLFREHWFDTILANQFTLKEIEDGTAWRKVNEK